jgi:hypothetical protein
MRRRSSAVAGAASVLVCVTTLLAARVSLTSTEQTGVLDWPRITREMKPWTRWWWMGSAVDRAGLTADLESLRAAGLGGVEVTPIYGVAGTESQFIEYLSDAWVRALEHTLREADRLDLGVDMATGTGWPFGGPWVTDRDACRTLVQKTWTVESGARLAERVRVEQPPMVRAIGNQVYDVLEIAPGEAAPQGTRAQPLARPGAPRIQIGDLVEPVEANRNLQALALEQIKYPKPLPLLALVAYSTAGAIIDLTPRVTPDGSLDWIAPQGTWTLYGVFLGWHGKLVERAAPGGEGNVIDHFSREAIGQYLGRFDRAFKGHQVKGVRAFFNDSYEVDDAQGESDGTARLFDEFQRRRGYDLRRHLPALFGKDSGTSASDASARVLADYRLTVSDLLLDTFTAEWRTWAARQSSMVRNQAHGSPASLLDLYAASDVPETEGTEVARSRWATSAAHVAGRRLVSAEAATWLGEHFRTSLADVRAAIDRFFIAGVNHIVYHGTAYSPQNDPWPGWQFYASVEFNNRNAWWRDFSALNDYVARVQSLLQAGAPDQDVLLYFPLYDSLAMRGPTLLKHFGGANPPPEGTVFERAAASLERRGYTYDFISDTQLQATLTHGERLQTSGGSSYATLVVPASRFIPLETFDGILSLARGGATVIAYDGLPEDVAGLADVNARRDRFRALRDSLRFAPADASGISEARIGRGAVLRGTDLDGLLARARVARETFGDRGLQFVRRKYDGGKYYFVLNPGGQEVDDWIPFTDRSSAAVIFDPATGRRGDARVRRSATGTLEVQMTLAPGASQIVATTNRPIGTAYPSYDIVGEAVAIQVPGPWSLRFLSGGPVLPSARSLERLVSWTMTGGEEVKSFSGTAVYSTQFRRSTPNAKAWRLDLGRVHESARVRLNGRDLGALLGPSYVVTIEGSLLSDSNLLEIEVTNLSANRIAALDRTGVRWRKFYNVNFPARLPQNRGADGLFTAAKWEPLDSGLIGPVTMTALSPR